MLASNELVFARVASKFRSLCGSLLPSMTLTLSKTKGCASEGLAIHFTRATGGAGERPGDAAADSSPYSSSSLEQLSGGQRTLVSLALLLSAAHEGAHSSVLLLDEVDAALDEHIQVREL